MKHLYIILIAFFVLTISGCYPDDDEVLKTYSYNPDNNKSDDENDQDEENETYPSVDLGLPSGTKWCLWNVGATSEKEYGKYLDWSDAHNSIPQGYLMPSYNQARELVNKCSWTWTSINGVYGYKGTGPNNNSIFLPAGGVLKKNSALGSEELSELGDEGVFWIDYDNTSEYSTHASASTIIFWNSIGVSPKISGEAQSSKLNIRCVKE